jgi:hypothetical protein
LTTLAPLSDETLLVPFRLVKKRYVLEVSYSGEGRWDYAKRKEGVESLLPTVPISPALEAEAAKIPKSTAALHFCDAVYGVEGDALFCETDGYTYEMGFYEHCRERSRSGVTKAISIVKEGSIAVPERLEARILSILREGSKAVYDLFCVAVYGNLTPDAIKTINDAFPEAVRIYRLNDEDLLKGAALYLGGCPTLVRN